MRIEDWFKQKLDSFKDDPEFRLETLLLDLTDKICKRMEQKNISRSKMADLLGVSPPAVTKILNGNSNFTLKTLLSLADVLDLNLKIDFQEKGDITTGTTLPDTTSLYYDLWGEGSFGTIITTDDTEKSYALPEPDSECFEGERMSAKALDPVLSQLPEPYMMDQAAKKIQLTGA
jgi:transcriptional regulator with XRE-family HTH domain